MNDICSICGDDYSVKFMYTLNCSHTFHYECIVKSFKIINNRNCPVCRNHSELLPMVNGLKKPISQIHYDYKTSSDEIEILNKFKNVKCSHILIKGKNKGKSCIRPCVIGFYKCSAHTI